MLPVCAEVQLILAYRLYVRQIKCINKIESKRSVVRINFGDIKFLSASFVSQWLTCGEATFPKDEAEPYSCS